MSVTEKVEINAAKSSFDDDEVNFEEAVAVVEATGNGEEDWAAKSGGWEATNDEAPDENWASWTESQTYKRQPSKDSQQQVWQKNVSIRSYLKEGLGVSICLDLDNFNTNNILTVENVLSVTAETTRLTKKHNIVERGTMQYSNKKDYVKLQLETT